MAEIILLNYKDSITFKDFNYEEMKEVSETFPELRRVTFEDCVISDFSLLEIFQNCSLNFIRCTIEDQSIPIKLNAKSIAFEETVVDFRRLFFMTDMPHIEIVKFIYDSIEGVRLYAPYFNLLVFYPTLKRICVAFYTADGYTYYDMDHKRKYVKDLLGKNLPALIGAKLHENLDFIVFLPKYKFKIRDGLLSLFPEDSDIYQRNRMVRKFWVDPKLMMHYGNYKYHDLKRIKATLELAQKLSKQYKSQLGITMKDLHCKNPIDTWPNLRKMITESLRCSVLGREAKQENSEPELSSLYGVEGQRLYKTDGHNIIVNSRGSIISDTTTKNGKTENHLLPF